MKHQQRVIQQVLHKNRGLVQAQVPACKQHSPPFVETVDSSLDPSVELSPDCEFEFQVFVEIGDGRTGVILLNQRSKPGLEAELFCSRYQLDSYVCQLLGQSLAEQLRKERQFVRSAQLHQGELSLEPGVCDFAGARITRKQARLAYSQKQDGSVSAPRINSVSQEIVRKLGKQNIIRANRTRFKHKAQEYKNQKFQDQQRSLQAHPFHPTINPISKKVDQTLNEGKTGFRAQVSRHQHLYENHRQIRSRADTRRRNSITELPFKPTINKVSQLIVARKKSMGDLQAAVPEQRGEKPYRKQEGNKRSRLKFSHSSQKLCHHLYEQAGLREQKLQKQALRLRKSHSGWKIIDSSNCLVAHARKTRVRQVFYELCAPTADVLHPAAIKYEDLSQLQQMFIPLFDQMRQLNEGLTEEEFVDAGLRLINYLTPDQRSLLVKRRPQLQGKQNQLPRPQINRRSQEIVRQKDYAMKGIYHRGMLFRRQVRQQVERGKEEKVRRQLHQCTFKPKVNKLATYNRV